MTIEIGDHVKFKPLKEVIRIWRDHFPKAEEINVTEFTKEVKDLMERELVVKNIRDAYIQNDDRHLQEVCFDFATQYAMPIDIFLPIQIEESDDVPSLFGTMSYRS